MQILKLNSVGNDVRVWQQFLVQEGYSITVDGNFGPQTDSATKDFQTKNGLVADGIVGPISWNFIFSLHHPAQNMIHSNTEVLQWIKQNLKPVIVNAVEDIFVEDWLAAIACRETGGLIVRYANRGLSLSEMLPFIQGDFTSGHYHGFSFWQIDIRSFPDFINSGDWKNPQKSAIMSVTVLQSKKRSLLFLGAEQFIQQNETLFERAITASYNCGEGDVIKAFKDNKDVDLYTANQNYSSQVFLFRETYKTL
jgi:hypothetical protein